MDIGIPKEIKSGEYRIAFAPEGIAALVKAGHKVIIEDGAGEGSGFKNSDYVRYGAKIAGEAEDVWRSSLIIKVKEPQYKEYKMLMPGQTLFSYLHLAASPGLVRILCKKRITAIDYATVQTPDGFLPLLKPMSEVAGKLSVQIGARLLERGRGGRGILIGGTSAVPPATVLILGGGTVGSNAAAIALGMGAKVILFEKNAGKMQQLKKIFRRFHRNFSVIPVSPVKIEKFLPITDLLIGAILIPGAKAPKIINKGHVQKMPTGSAIVDVAIDQGGCIETSHATTHKNPLFVKYGVLHYCVTNIPSLVSRTSTIALTNATLPYVLELASTPIAKIAKQNSTLANGINIYNGKITHRGLAESLGLRYFTLTDLL